MVFHGQLYLKRRKPGEPYVLWFRFTEEGLRLVSEGLVTKCSCETIGSMGLSCAFWSALIWTCECVEKERHA